ncbi:MAG: arginyl-tRNA--protein-N-Asp/Glu arginylyltransferase [Myxococcota bacterium]|jgi:arginyl-tRNA--protein-N-Asp/Glu arginylyltransferase
MAIRVLRPTRLSPAELDRYLEEGWFRIGQALMSCHAVLFDGVLRSALWTRLPIAERRYTKSNRKLIARNARRFTTEFGPALVDAEREALYQRYRAVVRGDRSPTLDDFLFGDSSRDVFDTWEVRIRDGDRLVAFSWFDRGRSALQSLLGVYEPDLASHSLGYYTMLQEVEYGARHGMTHFYPGYVLPGEPAMDYKLRVGEVEYLDTSAGLWRAWSEVDNHVLPVDRLRGALEAVIAELQALGLDGRIRRYTMFEAPAWHEHLRGCLDQPLVIEVDADRWVPRPLVVVFDLDRGSFRLLRCIRARALTVQREGEERRPVELWVVDAWLATCPDAVTVATEAERWWRG